MVQPPVKGETISTKEFASKTKVKDNVLMAKFPHNFMCIDDVKPEYPLIYAFEFTNDLNDGCGLAIVQLKDTEKRPIFSPFFCEVPLNKNITEDEMKSIVIERLKTVATIEDESILSKINFTKFRIIFKIKTFEVCTFIKCSSIYNGNITWNFNIFNFVTL